MKKVFLLLVMSLFIYSGIYSAESFTDENKLNQKQIENEVTKNNDDTEKMIIQTDKISKKEFKKIKRNNRKLIKNKKRIKNTMSSMLLVGAGLLVFGLLLYLVVTSATWLGIAVMVIGLVLLLYGVLKKFF